MKAPYKILFVVSNLERAGAEIQAVTLVNNLDVSKISAHLVNLSSKNALLERLDTTKVPYHQLERSFKFDLRIASQLATILKNERYDAIHCTEQFAMLVAQIANKLAGGATPVIAALHTTANVGAKQELLDRLLYRKLLGRCRRLVFVCDTQKKFWIDKYPELNRLSVTVHNGVDVDYFSPGINLPPFDQGALGEPSTDTVFTISCIAAFRKEKGHDILLHAFSTLPKRCRLLLAGQGMYKANVEALARELDISDRVHFLGSLDDVRPLLKVSDITVLASTAVETFSIAMLESMSMAVPMISADLGGMREAIASGKNGFLFTKGNGVELAKLLNRACDDIDSIKGMAQRARATVIEHFTIEGMVSKTTDCLLDVID